MVGGRQDRRDRRHAVERRDRLRDLRPGGRAAGRPWSPPAGPRSRGACRSGPRRTCRRSWCTRGTAWSWRPRTSPRGARAASRRRAGRARGGRRCRRPPGRAHARSAAAAAGAGAACTPVSIRAFSPRRRTRIPANERSAGVRVTAMSTAIATDAAPMLPIRPRNGMPVTLSATRAMMTVAPGEDHGVARGAVRQRDGLLDRVPLPELPAVPVDDEQRVVDADRQPEHDAEDRGDRHHVEHARERQRAERRDRPRR